MFILIGLAVFAYVIIYSAGPLARLLIPSDK